MSRGLSDFQIGQRFESPVVIIDEAQDLSDELLEQVRLLSNLETDHQKLMQIILMGQPELRDKLAQPKLRQLRHRITGRRRLGGRTNTTQRRDARRADFKTDFIF